jgi:hypothetical protein
MSNNTDGKTSFFNSIKIEEITFFLIILFSIIGVGITDYAPTASWAYWIFMVVVLCISAVIIEKNLLQRKDQSFSQLLTTQLLHWGATLLAILLSFAFVKTGRMTNEGSGLMILLIIALSTFLDGYHVGWRFYVAGIFLGLISIVAAYVEEFMWILFAVGLACLVLAVYVEKYLAARPGRSSN